MGCKHICGFVAQFSFNNESVDPKLLRRSAQDIHHRGPDDEGFEHGDWYSLGFKRLAIIDLSQNGHQPMQDPSGRYSIVFNGELYNYKELRKKLESDGVLFRSNSDTEVVLQSFIRLGPACLETFEGMFALIVVDKDAQEVFVARDQMGIKPLYFTRSDKQIVFASEVKALKHFVSFALNEDALYEQFKFRYVAGERTLFRGINRLKEGYWIKFNRQGEFSESKYFDVLDSLEAADSKPISTSEIEEELVRSIKMHTVSDVGYNIQLSGGIDSSYVTAILAKELEEQLHTFSVEVPGDRNDESCYQQYVSATYQTQHHRFSYTSKDYVSFLERATWHLDFPVVHSGTPFLMMLCSHSKKHSKVVLTGEGADELFGGYSRYYLSRKSRLAFWLKGIGVRPHHIPNLPKFRGLKNLLARNLGIDGVTFDSDVPLLTEVPESIDYRLSIGDRFPDLLAKMVASDQVCYLATLLERQDKVSMAESVETRVPLCTARLFKKVNEGVSLRQKINPLPKAILKKLSLKYYPKDFVYREKNGFKLPFAEWLRDPKGMGELLDLLTDESFKSRGFYNQRSINRCIKQHLSGDFDRCNQLFEIIRFELWYRKFIAA